jgi:hypothetical protein
MAGQPAPGHGGVAVPAAPAADRLLDLLRADPELLALEFELVVEFGMADGDLSTSADRTDPRPPRRRSALGIRRAPLPPHRRPRGPEPSVHRSRTVRRRANARQRGPPRPGDQVQIPSRTRR